MLFFWGLLTPAAQLQLTESDRRPPSTARGEEAYEIVFTGNATFDSATLANVVRREIAVVQRGQGSTADLLDAAATLKAWYTEQGFPDSRVRFRMVNTSEQGDHRIVTTTADFAMVDRIEFMIDEGPRLFLRNVQFDGNHAFDDAVLRSYVPRTGGPQVARGQSLYRPGDLGAIAVSVRRHYLRAGYLMVRVGEPVSIRDGNQVDVVIAVDEGEIFRVGDVQITGIDELPEDHRLRVIELLPQLRQPYTERVAADGANRVERYLGRNGFLASARYQIDLNPERALVTIRYLVDPGRLAVLGEIRVAGADDAQLRTRPSIVRNRFALVPGEPIDEDAIEAGRQALYQTGLFRIVSADIVDREPNATTDERIVDLVVTIEEDRNRYAAFAAGWSDVDMVIGSAEYVDENVFGSARLWGVGVNASFRGYRVSTRIVDRLLLGPRSRLSIEGAHEMRSRDAFFERSLRAALAADFYLTRELRASAISDFSYAMVEDFSEGGGEPQAVRLSSVAASVEWNTIDSVLFPTKGVRAESSASVSGTVLGLRVSFVRLGVGLTAHQRVGERILLSFQTTGETILPYADAVVPISERLYSGGSDSVRSFPHDALSPIDDERLPVGGLTKLEGKAEIRVETIPNLFIALFYDVGMVSSEPFALSMPGHAVGAGVRYRLPFGPLRLDFAINPGPRFAAERGWALHFSVGSGF